MSLVRDAQGKPLFVLAVSQNVTHLKQAEEEKNQLLAETQALNAKLESSQHKLLEQNEELKKINAELDNFVYRISHDMRAPLASVLGLINVCQLDRDGNNQGIYLNLMEKSVARLDTFIHDIINFSKNNRIEVLFQEIDLAALVTECLEGYDQVDKKFEIHQEAPFYSDIFRLKILFNNLLSNAIKYRSSQVEQASLMIRIDAHKDRASMEFLDNGQGIAPDKIDKIFDMFYRASDSSKGSGLGLYIGKEVVQTLKGSIHVHVQKEGGTRFTVEVPNGSIPLEQS